MIPQPKGFIALVSAIIISAILLVVVISGSLGSIYSRFDTLDAELKERSASAADACADQALLKVANDPAYTGTVLLTLNASDSCRAVTATVGSQKSVRVQATSSTAVTSLQLVLKSSDATVLSWQEVPIF